MAFESPKPEKAEKKRKVLTPNQRATLRNIGVRGKAALREIAEDHAADPEFAGYLRSALEEVEAMDEEYGPGGITLESGISEKEADEILEAQRELAKKEEEQGEEGLPLTKEEAPWVFDKSRLEKIWEDIKKLFQ